jgi:hypothetical protein
MPRKKKSKQVAVVNETNGVKSFHQGSIVLQPGVNLLSVDQWESIRDTRTIRQMSIKSELSITYNVTEELAAENTDEVTEENAAD